MVDKEVVKAHNPPLAVAEALGLELKREGSGWKARCPGACFNRGASWDSVGIVIPSFRWVKYHGSHQPFSHVNFPLRGHCVNLV